MPITEPEAIQENLNFGQVLREYLTCAIIAVDAQEQVVIYNSEAESLMQLKANEILHHSFRALPRALHPLIEEAFRVNGPLNDRHIVIELPTGETFPVQVSTAAGQTAGGKGRQVILVLNDSSLADGLDQDMRRIERLSTLGTLSASMAHEIKNALVAGKTFVDLLLEKNQDSELAGIVRRELSRIDSLLNQMLKFAAPARSVFAKVRLHEVLDHSLRLVQPQLKRKSIALNRQFQAVPDLVTGDDYQLQQAFVNLLLNALEAMETTGTLTVTTLLVAADPILAIQPAPETKEIMVRITDTGVGIPEENMGRLFEPFFTTKEHGTGLGLPITRRIVQEHRGLITVESEFKKGTTFITVLPAAETNQ